MHTLFPNNSVQFSGRLEAFWFNLESEKFEPFYMNKQVTNAVDMEQSISRRQTYVLVW